MDRSTNDRPVVSTRSKFCYLGGSKELLQSSPSTTSTEELDQIDGGGRRFLKRESNYNANDGERDGEGTRKRSVDLGENDKKGVA